MKYPPRLWAVSCSLALMACPPVVEAAPYISEIMFHPAHAERLPEPVAQEWFELHNPGPAIDLSGWRMRRGVDFVFPAGTVIQAGACLVVAADAAAFRAARPGFSGALVGGWTGRLSNKGERLTLADPAGNEIDDVEYSDGGDWAMRARQAVDQYGHQGWQWVNPADGLGRSIEKQVATLPFAHGRNWKPSPADGGTPGVLGGGAPDGETVFISEVEARPLIPRSTEPIEITARIDDAGTGSSAQSWRLRWRLDGAAAFQQAAMEIFSQETISTEGAAVGRFHVRGTIPPQADRAVVEFYIEARGRGGQATWPPPARISEPGVEPAAYGQAANCLLQVDNSFDAAAVRDPAAQPVYRMILKAEELAQLRSLQASSSRSNSEATMNVSFAAYDGSGLSARWQCGLRNRGFSSRVGPPNNYHLAFPGDEAWEGHGSFQFNCRYPHSQVLAAAIFGLAGLPIQEAAPVQVRLNGVNYGVPGSGNNFNATITYGAYARTEALGGDWVDRHFPDDSGGNLYRVDDHSVGNSSPTNRFRYPGSANPDIYDNIYLKETNEDLDDYADLADLFNTLNNAPAEGFAAAVASKINLDQWLAYFAIDALIGNQEGGLGSGRTDDFSMYRGEKDTRFVLIPHDFDTTMNYGTGGQGGSGVTRSLFSYVTVNNGIDGLQRFFNDPDILRAYYAKTLELLDTVFTRARLDPVIDELFAGWVPPAVAQVVKDFITARRANVLDQIRRTNSISPAFGSTLEGMPLATSGSAPVAGQFHVAKVSSVRVNGQPAQLFYRPSGADAAGTWRLNTGAAPGFWKPGLNRLSAQFFDGPDGTGALLETQTLDVWFNPAGRLTEVNAAGVPLGTALFLQSPVTYIPGVPFVVEIERRNALGQVDRARWSEEVTLSGGSVALRAADGGEPRVTLHNGRGSLLVAAESTATVAETLVQPGGRNNAPNPSAALWKYLDTGGAPPATWRSSLAFDDSVWLPQGLPGAPGEFGGGDGDERTVVAGVPANDSVANPRFTWYFRHRFDVPDPSRYVGLNLRFICDDGMAVYLNGTELTRYNLAAGAGHGDPSIENLTGGDIETRIISANVPVSALASGANLLAAEVHNARTGTNTVSVDLGFDLEVRGLRRQADPGNFLLTASSGGETATRSIASLGETPASSTVSGILAADTTWQGVVRVTGDVTVPAGRTLTIAPGTHVLLAGTSGAGSTSGADLIIQGTLALNGTAAEPVSLTAASADSRWGEIFLSSGATAQARHAFITRGAHSTGRGHTGTGPILRLSGAALTMEDCVVSDFPGKAIFTSGTSSVTLRRCHLARMVTGPETGDGCAVLIEDSHLTDALPIYREAANARPDDEDTLYLHNGAGRSVVVRGTVLARAGDDVIDCLGGPVVIENCIIRDGWDKGISLLNNDLSLSRSFIIACDKAIAAKSSTSAARAIEIAHCTIVGEEHDTTLGPWGYAVAPSSPDPDTTCVGLYTQNKSGQSNTSSVIRFNVRDSIILAAAPVQVDAPYPAANTTVRYSLFFGLAGAPAPVWPGTGNLQADPLFVSAFGPARDFRLSAASPAINAGDPASPADPDGSRADMGALPRGGFPLPAGQDIVWAAEQSPLHLTHDLVIPAGKTLTVEPGVSVYFDPNRRLTVRGALRVLGTAEAKVIFSHVPGTVAQGDADPIAPGVQTGPGKWGGLRLVDSLAQENVIQHAHFLNAQGTSPAGAENEGSLGIIRSWALCDHLSFSGTRMRQLYARNSKLTVQNSVFPAPFAEGEDPAAFGLNGGAEAIKIEYPANDPAVQNAGFVEGFPAGGWCRVLDNTFYGNSGRNDVVSVESGQQRLAMLKTNIILDCRNNHFHGPVGASHLRVSGDALISRNIFHRAAKDPWSRDTRHASAISAAGRHEGTTLMVAANVFYEVDHALELNNRAGALFEYNTVANINPDYTHISAGPEAVSQQVKTSAIHLFAPEVPLLAPGAGAYLNYNIVSQTPRLFSGADQGPAGQGAVASKIELPRNLFYAIADPAIGAAHPGGIFSPSYGINAMGDPMFVDAAAGDFRLRQGSAALATAPGENNYGAAGAEGVLIFDGPPAVSATPGAAFSIGGPAFTAYRWRLDGGPWSAELPLGGAGFSPASATVRHAALSLPNLPPGPHVLRLVGQDFAGNWQLEEEAAVWTWTVLAPGETLVLLSEIVADAADGVDWIELHNAGAAAVNLGGWGLGDRADGPLITFAPGLILEPGGYLNVPSTTTGLRSSKEGDAVYLFQNSAVRDSVVFGPQLQGHSIARLGASRGWGLAVPTPGEPNRSALAAGPGGVRLTEWFASSDVRFENDWVELHNPGLLPVALEGVALTDNRAGRPLASVFPPLSYLAPGGYLLLHADDEPGLGPTHLGFKLDQLQDRISLLAADGSVIDGHAFYGQAADMSQSASGAGRPVFHELPTAGFAMSSSDPAYQRALALQRGLRITEIMYNAAGGNEYDWVELSNAGLTALPLAGVAFVEGIEFVFGAVTLAPGQSVVVVANEAAFRAQYGSTPVVAGVYSGRLDNGGERLRLQLPAPFSSGVLDFRYEDFWFPETDGVGRSLELADGAVSAAAFADRRSWRASPQPGGTPGAGAAVMVTGYPSWKTYFRASESAPDADADGVPLLLEYALDTDPSLGSYQDGPGALPQLIAATPGQQTLRLVLPTDHSLVQGHGRPDVHYEIQAAETLGAWTTLAIKTPVEPWTGPAAVSLGAAQDGWQPVTITSTASPPRAFRFFRLRVAYQP